MYCGFFYVGCSQWPYCKHRGQTVASFFLSHQHETRSGISLLMYSLMALPLSQTQKKQPHKYVAHTLLCPSRPLSWLSVCNILDVCFVYWENQGIGKEPAEQKSWSAKMSPPKCFLWGQHTFWIECNGRATHLHYMLGGECLFCAAHLACFLVAKSWKIFNSLFAQLTNHSGGGVGQIALR